MDILVFGGFLGSGKTTIIGKTLRGLVEHGKTIALIENEIGEIGIDDVFFEGEGMKVVPLFGGCVCCQISGSLLVAIKDIEDEINPDVIVIEMTGLALTGGIREIFEFYPGKTLSVHVISVLDLARWDKLMLAMGHLIEAQLEGADMVLLNKEDLSTTTEEAHLFARSHAPDAQIITISAHEEDPAFVGEIEKMLQAQSEGGSNA